MNESSFEGVGGLKIFTRSWRPAVGKPRAVVVIVHGFNSHSGYYTWVAEQFVANDLAVYALDLRGRGKSDGERFYPSSPGSSARVLPTRCRPRISPWPSSKG